MSKNNRAKKCYLISKTLREKQLNECHDFVCPKWSVWVLSPSLLIFLFGSTKSNWQPRETCYLFHTEIHHLHLITRRHFYHLQWQIFLHRAEMLSTLLFLPNRLFLCIPIEVFEIILTAVQELCLDLTWAGNSIGYCSFCCSQVCSNSSWVFVPWLKWDAPKLWQTVKGVDLLVEVRLTLSTPALISNISWPSPRKREQTN